MVRASPGNVLTGRKVFDPDGTRGWRVDTVSRRADSPPALHFPSDMPYPGHASRHDAVTGDAAYSRVVWSDPDHGLAVLDDAGGIVMWTPVAEALTGFPAREATGRPLVWLLALADVVMPVAGLLEAARRSPVREARWWRRRGGGRFWCESTLFAVRDDSGTCGGFALAMRDCTRAHIRDLELAQRAASLDDLRRSKAMLTEAERVARMGSWEWDLDRNEVRWSEGMYSIYGIDPAGAGHVDPMSAERIHPDDHDRVGAAVARALETGEAIELDYRIVRTDGRMRRLRGRAEVIVDDDGRPTRVAGTAQDVTEVWVAEDPLGGTAAELARRSRAARAGTAPAVPQRRLDDLLSTRQLQVLRMVAEGCSNSEIADRLYLSEGTIKWHVRQILRIVGATNRAQAIARYLASDTQLTA